MKTIAPENVNLNDSKEVSDTVSAIDLESIDNEKLSDNFTKDDLNSTDIWQETIQSDDESDIPAFLRRRKKHSNDSADEKKDEKTRD